jgi:lipoprotein-anchoring transpeptidase ErfK/SrfK
MLTIDAAQKPWSSGEFMRRFIFALACAGALTTSAVADAQAEIFISVNKSAQRMTVAVDGREYFRWPVSTGVDGGPPSGRYQPERMERMWYSRRYDWSPMPHAIFFHKGYAIHGTNYLSRLGRPASHGCVRLHPAHAAELFALVRSQGMRRVQIVVSGGSPLYASRPW